MRYLFIVVSCVLIGHSIGYDMKRNATCGEVKSSYRSHGCCNGTASHVTDLTYPSQQGTLTVVTHSEPTSTLQFWKLWKQGFESTANTKEFTTNWLPTAHNASLHIQYILGYCNTSNALIVTVPWAPNTTEYVMVHNAINRCIRDWDGIILTANTDTYHNEDVITYVGSTNYEMGKQCARSLINPLHPHTVFARAKAEVSPAFASFDYAFYESNEESFNYGILQRIKGFQDELAEIANYTSFNASGVAYENGKYPSRILPVQIVAFGEKSTLEAFAKYNFSASYGHLVELCGNLASEAHPVAIPDSIRGAPVSLMNCGDNTKLSISDSLAIPVKHVGQNPFLQGVNAGSLAISALIVDWTTHSHTGNAIAHTDSVSCPLCDVCSALENNSNGGRRVDACHGRRRRRVGCVQYHRRRRRSCYDPSVDINSDGGTQIYYNY